jgi:hypothetical protein
MKKYVLILPIISLFQILNAQYSQLQLGDTLRDKLS